LFDNSGTALVDKAAQGDDITVQTHVGTIVPATLKTYHSRYFFDLWDEYKSDQNFRDGLTKKAIADVNRQLDTDLSAVLKAATITQVVNETDGITAITDIDYLALASVKAAFRSGNVNGTFHGMVSDTQYTNIILDPLISNNFHNGNNAVQDDTVGRVAGFTSIVDYTGLPTAATSGDVENYFWEKDAVGIVVNKAMSHDIKESVEKIGWYVTASATMGFAAVDPTGIRYISAP